MTYVSMDFVRRFVTRFAAGCLSLAVVLFLSGCLGFSFPILDYFLTPVETQLPPSDSPSTGSLDSNGNHPPEGQGSTLATPMNTSCTVTLAATDADGDPLTYSIVTAPQHGTLSGDPPVLTYVPAGDYLGTDTVIFKANDGQADGSPATVTITTYETTITAGWTMEDGNARNNRYTAVLGPAQPALKWKIPLGCGSWVRASDRRIYLVQSGKGQVYDYDGNHLGEIPAIVNESSDIYNDQSRPVLAPDVLYGKVTTTKSDGSSCTGLGAVRLHDGVVTWCQDAIHAWYHLILGPDGTLYCNYTNGLFAVDSQSGAIKWSLPLMTSQIMLGPDGKLFVCDGSWIYALDAATGTTQWAYSLPCNAILGGNDSLLARVGNQTYCMNPADGTVRWQGEYCHPLALVDNDTLFGRTEDDMLLALDASTGSARWKNGLAHIWIDGIVDGGKTVYIPTFSTPEQKSVLNALRPDNTTKWSVGFDGYGSARNRAVLSDGTLLVEHGVDERWLYAFGAGGNQAPVAQDQYIVTPDSNQPVDIQLQASDPEGQPLTYEIVGLPEYGTLSYSSLPNIRYTFPTGYFGYDPTGFYGKVEFSFRAYDGTSWSNNAKVTVQAGYYLNVRVVGSNRGRIRVDPIGVLMGHYYPAGTVVSVQADVDTSGSRYEHVYTTFDHWEGDLTGNSKTATITMDKNRTVTGVYRIVSIP
jgi:outer membrane protein assembly factor BamB